MSPKRRREDNYVNDKKGSCDQMRKPEESRREHFERNDRNDGVRNCFEQEKLSIEKSNRHENDKTRIRSPRRSKSRTPPTPHNEKRDTVRDSRYDKDKDYLSANHDRRKTYSNHSREQSPTQSHHSKFSRGSSIGSDHSRRSSHIAPSRAEASETNSLKNRSYFDKSAKHKINDVMQIDQSEQELKNYNKTSGIPISEEMSPISTTSSITDGDSDSKCGTKTELETKEIENLESAKTTTDKSERCSKSIEKDAKDEDRSANYSDWSSDDEDEVLAASEPNSTLGDFSSNTIRKGGLGFGKGDVDDISQHSLTNGTTLDSVNENVHEGSNKPGSWDGSLEQEQVDSLEAISDDELDAIIGDSDPVDANGEAKNSTNSKQMLDALDIDWASLINTNKRETQSDVDVPGSVRNRFTPAKILSKMGFSHAFAGPQLTEKIVELCRSELNSESVPSKHSVPSFHTFINARLKERRRLFQSDNILSTALSSRKDLQLRKMLNKSSL